VVFGAAFAVGIVKHGDTLWDFALGEDCVPFLVYFYLGAR
jgi:hypothetical protein